jgi:hypothetical protein
MKSAAKNIIGAILKYDLKPLVILLTLGKEQSMIEDQRSTAFRHFIKPRRINPAKAALILLGI